MAASTPTEAKSVMSGPVTGTVTGSVTISDTTFGDAGTAFVTDTHSGSPDDSQDVESCGDRPCCPAGRFWVQADYLSWWTKGTHLPPLVTTSGTGTDSSGLTRFTWANRYRDPVRRFHG